MSERGVFAVDRGIWDHDLLADSSPFSRREAWLWLVSEAAWKPHRRRLAGKIIDLGRGQFAGSLRFIASKWRWSEPRVRRFFHALISDAMIDAKTDAGITVVTICNYDDYQRVSLPSDANPEVIPDAPATQERRKVEDRENKESIKKNLSVDFERFKVAYPKRDGANPWEPARKKFIAAVKSGVDPETIISGAKAYAVADAEKIGTPYIVQATRWFNERRWADYATPLTIAADTPESRGWRPGLPTDEELRAKYAERRKAEKSTGAEPDVLAEGPRVRDENGDGLVRDKAGDGRVRQLGELFSEVQLETVGHEATRTSEDRDFPGAGAMAGMV